MNAVVVARERDRRNREKCQEFEDFCGSDDLTLGGLQEIIRQLPTPGAPRRSSFFHVVCANENVTLDIINFLLDYYPDAAKSCSNVLCEDQQSTAYPLHHACENDSCPSSVIELLVEKHPYALSHLGVLDGGVYIREDAVGAEGYVEGTPLHYYLARESDNIDIEVVKTLVAACPTALEAAGASTKLTPIHALLCNYTVKNLVDVVQFLAEANPHWDFQMSTTGLLYTLLAQMKI